MYSRPSPVRIALIRILANPNTHDFNGLRMCIMHVYSCEIFGKMATGNSKRKPHKTLTIDEKVEIVDQIGKKSYTVISEEYGIGRATITDIKRKEVEIRNFKSHMHEMGTKRSAKIMKMKNMTKLYFCGLNKSVKKCMSV